MPSEQKHYNQRLIERGSITFWIDDTVKSNWYKSKETCTKKGRPFYYSDEAVYCPQLS